MAVTGLANIYSADSFTQLENLYKSNYSNISEAIGPAGNGYIAQEFTGKSGFVTTGGASGIQVFMDQNTGYTMVRVGVAGSDYSPPFVDATNRVFAALITDKVANLPSVSMVDNEILDSPLYFSKWVNRNTLVAKPAEPLLRVNRLEVYPEGGVAANVVSLTTDYLSNLVVSNVNSTILTCGPN